MSVQYGGDKITFADGSSTSSGYTGFKNRIINGAMVIDQRNAGSSVTNPGSNVYIIDRWYTNTSFNGTIGQNLGGVTPPNGFKNYFGMAAGSENGVSNYAFRQVIEGYNVADLEWGTANAKTVTLSFWVRSSLTGTFGGSVTNYDQNRCYVFGYTISQANTWEYKTFVVPGDTTGTWNTNNSGGIHIYISQGCASAKKTSAGSWNAGDYRTVSDAVDLLTTNGATFYITGVQLEVGSSATTFEYRDYGRELQMCQRYYEKLTAGNGSQILAYSNSTSILAANWQFMVTKRAAPTVAQVSPVTSFTSAGINDYTGVWNFVIYGNSRVTNVGMQFNYASGSTVGTGTMVVASQGLILTADAEL